MSKAEQEVKRMAEAEDLIAEFREMVESGEIEDFAMVGVRKDLTPVTAYYTAKPTPLLGAIRVLEEEILENNIRPQKEQII